MIIRQLKFLGQALGQAEPKSRSRLLEADACFTGRLYAHPPVDGLGLSCICGGGAVREAEATVRGS